jgi:hypothetical protein
LSKQGITSTLTKKKTPRQLASPSFITFEKNEKKENME